MEYPFLHLKNEFDQFAQWKIFENLQPEGIITGCSYNMQTMIPWWWKNYRQFNARPVTFVDFGMDNRMRRYCASKGNVISLFLPKYLLKHRFTHPKTLIKKLNQKHFLRLKLERMYYFHKLFALLSTPYQYSAWIDIDCQIKSNINTLFDYAKKGVSLTPMSPFKHQHSTQGEVLPSNKILFNSGVICYVRGSRLFIDCAKAAVVRKKWYFGDQDILNEIIYESNTPINRLPNTYNWIVKEWGNNPHAKILHFAGLEKRYDQESFSTFKILPPQKPYHW